MQRETGRHPDGVAVFLSDCDGRFTFPDGRTEAIQAKAGQAVWTDSTEHLPENLSDQPLDLILLELKG